MDNLFEDIKREYVNRFSETNGILLAQDYDSFVAKMIDAICESIVTTPEGHDIMNEACRIAHEHGLSLEQWQQQKISLIRTLFFMTLSECPQLKHEFSLHLYNELRKT